MNVCVYCSSAEVVGPAYRAAAESLGAELAARGHGLVYGGTAMGLMGVVADTVRANGGRVVGVVPQRIADRGIGDHLADELIVTADMAERKAVMEDRADAFVLLPGGFGTLEELSEVLTLKQLGYHDKAIVLIDVASFWAPLLAYFAHLYELGFARPEYDALFDVVHDAAAALDRLETYAPADLPAKRW